VPTCHIAWISQSEASPYPAAITVETPIYLALDREALLSTVDVPSSGDPAARVIAGVALFLNRSDD